MINKKISFISLVIILLFCICVIESNKKLEDAKMVNAGIVNKKKISWGIKSNENNEQPDVGIDNKNILEKNDGICLGNENEKFIYMTFDEGYEAGYTDKILDILNKNNVKATFFITAHYLNTQSDLVKRMIDEGHIVGNHTVNHKSMPELSDEEIKNEVMSLHTAVYEKFGYEMKYIRPPKGEFSKRTLELCNKMGYINVMWSFAYVDWDEKNQPNILEAKEKILNHIHNGEIMLLHGNSKTNLEILNEIICEIKNKGYEFKNLDEFKK